MVKWAASVNTIVLPVRERGKRWQGMCGGGHMDRFRTMRCCESEMRSCQV